MLQPKAYYNLLKRTLKESPSEDTKWATEDLKKVSLEELLYRIPLRKERFFEKASLTSSPEELADHLSIYQADQYLALFELWKRLLPDIVV